MSDSLQTYLKSIERAEDYRLIRVLKDSVCERTELVSKVNDSSSLFVRKIIDRQAGIGDVYESLWKATCAGVVFAHLPCVYEYFRTESHIVVVMEYFSGITLQEALVASNNPNEASIHAWFIEICDAVIELETSFQPPIIHRDLKPSNVIVTANALKLVDFGISRTFREGATEDTTHFGTRGFAPPEQFGFGQTDVRSDVYALGALLYYLYTGRVPSREDFGSNKAFSGIPDKYIKVIRRATELDPSRRYADAKELKTAFLMAGTEEKEPTVFRTIVGKIWNGFLIAQLVFIGIGVAGFSIPSYISNCPQYPVWFCVMSMFCVVIIPEFGLTISLYDKSRLRRRFPDNPLFQNKRIVPPVLAICFISLFAVIVIAQVVA